MKNTKLENWAIITSRMSENASRIKYGVASVDLKIHNGHIVSVMYSVTEKTKGGMIKY